MPLVSTKEMFAKAYTGGYAIGAFNISNMEILQGVVEAAQEEASPLILQVTESSIKYIGYDYLMKLIEAAIITAHNLPICLHLDHGCSFEICKFCIDNGFTSVMIDGSHLPFEDNITLTNKVVQYAHDRGVVVEGELGQIAGIEDNVKLEQSTNIIYTDPFKAEEFVSKTNIDSLAVAIGTSHGIYKFKGKPNLRFDILNDISDRIPMIPIVLHGASSMIPEYIYMTQNFGGKLDGANGIPESFLRKAASMAVCKINIDSDMRLVMTAILRKCFNDDPTNIDPRKYLMAVRITIKKIVSYKLVHILGCNKKI